MAEKHTARLASFVILEREGKMLLMQRLNTGYQDGRYQMPSGHIEPNEYPSEAAIRETKEELGIDIAPEDLTFLHASYRIKNRDGGDYVDFFFRASKWAGEIINAEPAKCSGLIWAPMDQLPENTVPAIRTVIECLLKDGPFSEIGRGE